MLTPYIHNLIENLPTKERNLDIVLEGGAFNGSFEYGILYFLQELKKKHPTIIGRVSGVSIGAVLGLLFLIEKLEIYKKYYDKIRNHLKKNANMDIVYKITDEIFEKISDDEFEKIKYNKLFIHYYDTEQKKLILRKKYETKDDLKKVILRTCYIPFLIDGNYLLENKFIDGCFPYIFPEREKQILYVKISQICKLTYMLNTKNEKNISGRALEGIIDIYNFFLHNKPTNMCSWVNNWMLFDFIKLRCKRWFILSLVYYIYTIIQIFKQIKPFLCVAFFEQSEYFQRIKPILCSLYKDFILYLCF